MKLKFQVIAPPLFVLWALTACSTSRAISPNSPAVGLAGRDARLKIHFKDGTFINDKLLYDAPDSIHALKKSYSKDDIQFIEISEYSGSKTSAAVASAASGIAIIYVIVVIAAILPALIVLSILD